jgi:membrane glycosyltransferase
MKMDHPQGPIDDGSTPPPARLAMPDQRLDVAPTFPKDPPPARTVAARLTAFGGAAAITAAGVWQMAQVFDTPGSSPLEIALLFLFALTFGWIAFSAASAIAGLLFGPRAPVRLPEPLRAPVSARTAILAPLYNEDPTETAGALAALGQGLARMGLADRFDIFLLSDSRDPDALAREPAAFAALRAELPDGPAVWRRRRSVNTGKKAGNIRDFVERWGAAYEFMLVLDADSLMDADTVAEMVRRMQADPRLGLLQTNPALIGGQTPWARMQEFASSLYGAVIARGMAAWQGFDGNYWGHNALIRTKAFAEAAGLPDLPGRAPFGGPILSHDFVEAALMRRAGWRVRMDPDLAGGFEGSPPSLLASAIRDRRWAQGNLQHLGVIGAKGLRWPNRAHLAIGVGSYLASPIWLMMMIVGLSLTAQALFGQHDYFPDADQLFPRWPTFDAEQMRMLFFVSLAMLMAPRCIGVVHAIFNGPRRRGFGGAIRLTLGAVVETLLGALMAPAMMMIQTSHVMDILLGRDAGWGAQARRAEGMRWLDAIAAHRTHLIMGLVLTGVLWMAQPFLLVWFAPVAAGLILAPALSKLSGDARVGAAMGWLGLFDTPQARTRPEIAVQAQAATARIAAATPERLELLIADRDAASRHAAALGRDGVLDLTERLARVTAQAKIAAAPDAATALSWMTVEERRAVAACADLTLALNAPRPEALAAE